MKKLLLLWVFAIMVSISATSVKSTVNPTEEGIFELPTTAESIIGTWKTIDDETGKPKSEVRIYLAKNGKYYGQIEKLLNREPGEDADPVCNVCPGDRKGQKIIGMKIVLGLVKKNDDYVDGTILDPKSGKVYNCKVWTKGENELNVRGYVGPFFRTQIWHRIK